MNHSEIQARLEHLAREDAMRGHFIFRCYVRGRGSRGWFFTWAASGGFLDVTSELRNARAVCAYAWSRNAGFEPRDKVFGKLKARRGLEFVLQDASRAVDADLTLELPPGDDSSATLPHKLDLAIEAEAQAAQIGVENLRFGSVEDGSWTFDLF